MKHEEITIAYTRDEFYWDFSTRAGKLCSAEALYKKIKENRNSITYICFVSGKGLYIQTDPDELNHFYYEKPGPEILEYLCEMMFFGPKANAKMWYCAFKYSLENKDCITFWEKYKDTTGAAKFMSLILGQKEALDNI